MRGVELGLLAAELGDRVVAVDPLARDPVPVAARPQLAHDRQREHLQPAAEEVVGRQRLVAHLREVRRARVGHLDHHLGRDLGREGDLLVLEVPPRHVADLREDPLRGVVLGLGDEAAGDEVVDHRGAVAGRRDALDLELELGDGGRDALEQAEVEERHPAVVEQQRVAGVRVTGELVVAVHAAEVEAVDDLAEAVALVLRELLELLEAAALDELADDHLLV